MISKPYPFDGRPPPKRPAPNVRMLMCQGCGARGLVHRELPIATHGEAVRRLVTPMQCEDCEGIGWLPMSFGTRPPPAAD